MADVEDSVGPILVWIETDREGAITPATRECLSVAIETGGQTGADVVALCSGRDAETVAADASRYAVHDVRILETALADPSAPEALAAMIVGACAELRPSAVFLGESLVAADLAPRIAFALGVALVTDCARIDCRSGELRLSKSVYGGNVVATFAPETVPFVAILQSGCANAATKRDQAPAEVAPLAITLDVSLPKVEVLERVVEPRSGPALAEASVVVAGGRGVGGVEGFRTIGDLARLLHGAVAASRPACDAGWAPAACQVGLTGQRVAPSVYIAAGISGASQHLAGMSRARTIVAINRDARASMFQVAHYGVVGVWEEVGPAFRDAVARMRESRS